MDAEALQQEDIALEDFEELSAGEAPPEASFPIIIFSFAVLKDLVVDPLLTGVGLTGAGLPVAVILGFIINFVFGLVLFLWLLGKINFVQKRLLRSLIRRAALALLAGSIPGVSLIIPETTILVLVVHNREKEIVKLFLSGLEKIEGSTK